MEEKSRGDVTREAKRETDKQFHTDLYNENFGKVKNTKEVQNAAARQNAEIDAGRNPEDFLPNRPYGILADEIGGKVAEDLEVSHTDLERIAKIEAQRKILGIESAQKSNKEVLQKIAENTANEDNS